MEMSRAVFYERRLMAHEFTVALSTSLALHVCALYPLTAGAGSPVTPGAGTGAIEVVLVPSDAPPGGDASSAPGDVAPDADAGLSDAIVMAALAPDLREPDATTAAADALPPVVHAPDATRPSPRAVARHPKSAGPPYARSPHARAAGGPDTGAAVNDGVAGSGGGVSENVGVATSASDLDATVPPQPTAGNRRPEYPLAARRKGYEGSVALRFEVPPEPSAPADRIEVVGSSGYEILDAAAEAAVRSWRFQPATQLGRPTRYTIVQRFRFALTNR